MGRGFEQDRPKCDLHHHVRLIYRSYLASFSKLAYDLEDIGCSVKTSNPPTFSVHLVELGGFLELLGGSLRLFVVTRWDICGSLGVMLRHFGQYVGTESPEMAWRSHPRVGPGWVPWSPLKEITWRRVGPEWVPGGFHLCKCH